MTPRRLYSSQLLVAGSINFLNIGPLTIGDWLESAWFMCSVAPAVGTVNFLLGMCQRPITAGTLQTWSDQVSPFYLNPITRQFSVPASTVLAELPLWHKVALDRPYLSCSLDVLVGGAISFNFGVRLRPAWRQQSDGSVIPGHIPPFRGQ